MDNRKRTIKEQTEICNMFMPKESGACDLLIINDYPTNIDCKVGHYASNESRVVLNAIREIGIPYKIGFDFSIGCVSERALKADDIYRCASRIKKRIQEAKPKVIIAMGTTAARSLGFKKPIKQLRGTTVVMWSYWPTEYLRHPDEKIDLMRKGSNVEEAKRRLTDFALEHGFIDKPVANMLGVGTKTDRNAIEAWQERLSKLQRGLHDCLPALYLHKNGQWDNILSQIQEDTGLPVLGTYKAPGRGGRSLVIGTVERLEGFYTSIGSVLSKDLYDLADK